MADLCKRISDWLAAPDPSENYSAAQRLRKKGTATWFTTSDKFIQWKYGAQPCLWIYGSMGSGKSTLCSTIIMDIEKYCNAKSSHAVAYFFFDSRGAQEGFRFYHKLLRSIIKQLLAQCAHVPQPTLHTYNNGCQSPEHDSLPDMVNHLLAVFDQVYIILDALDECEDYWQLLRWIHSLVGKNSQKIHILGTTRPEITTLLESLDPPSSQYVDLNNASGNDDIESYIRDRVFDSDDFSSFSEEVRQNMLNTLCKKAKGMFRWVALQLDDLVNCFSDDNIEEQLENIPTNLYKTYTQVIDRIPAKRQADTMKFLQWLAFSFRPLKLMELREIPGINIGFEVGGSKSPFNSKAIYHNPKDILRVCSSFVVINEDYIKLAHLSVKEYLMLNSGSGGPPPDFHLEEKLSHMHIAQMCLVYLLQFQKEYSGSITEMSHMDRTHPLLDYCACKWISHYKCAGDGIFHITAELLRTLFLEQSQQFILWHSYVVIRPQLRWGLLERQDPLLVALHTACLEGSIEVVQLLIKEGVDINLQPGGNYDTALIAACHTGRIEIVQLLLKEGADINVQTGGRTALIAACHTGRIEIVQLLLKGGADINVQTDSCTALIATCQKASIETIQLLLKEGADINAQTGGYYGTALIAACENGSLELVQLLLKEGADINAQGGYCWSALIGACKRKDIEMVQLLLKEGADVNAQAGGIYGTPLISACQSGSFDMIQLLLKEGVDVNAQGGTHYCSALIAACQRKIIQMVQLLLKEGANVNVQAGGHYGTALIAACIGENFMMVRLLLTEGAEINVQEGGHYGSALIAACWRGSIEIVQLLLKEGADINAQAGGIYGTALIAACEQVQFKIIQLLLKEGANVNAQAGGHYGTALIAACSGGHFKMVQLLLTEGADINVQAGGHCGSALIAACWRGSIEIVQLLLKEGADLNAQAGGEYGTPLIAGCWEGHIEIVKLLLNNGADINMNITAVTEETSTALLAAIHKGHNVIVQLLLNIGVDLWDHFDVARLAAKQSSCPRIVELLDIWSYANSHSRPL
ncbi:ankyrin repeat-containing domain protein [Hysterangium stoloniferum]|nr:ankyrin repeat-containing domain protein [Hysterangium stoloniferum]